MSCQLFAVVEDKEILDPIQSVNGLRGNFMIFDNQEDTHDGTFPRVSDYTRLANRMDTEGTSEYLTWISKRHNKLKADNGYCTVVRDSKHSHRATLYFERPIQIQVATVNAEPVLISVNEINGEFTHEWFWTRNGRQDKIANGFSVYFDCQEYFLR